MRSLYYVPQSEFKRISEVNLQQETRCALLSGMSRINQLVYAERCGISLDHTQQNAVDLLIWLSNEHDTDSPESTTVVDLEPQNPALRAVQFANSIVKDLFASAEVHPDSPESNAWFMAVPGTAIPHGIGMAIGRTLRKVPGRVTVLADAIGQWRSQLCNPLVTLMREDLKSLCVIVRADEREDFDWSALQRQLIAFGWRIDVCDSITCLDKAYHRSVARGDGPKVMMCRFDSSQEFVLGSSALEMESATDAASESFQNRFDVIGDQLDIELSSLGIHGLHYEAIECEERISTVMISENLADTVGELLLQLAAERDEIMLLDAVPTSNRHFKRFQALYPGRYLHSTHPADAASAALGLAREGLLPVLNTTAASHIDDSMMRPEARVIHVSHDAGLPDESRFSGVSNLNDIAQYGSQSNCVIIQPCCAAEAYHALQYAVEGSCESVTLRISSGNIQSAVSLPVDYYFRPGRGAILRNGRDALLFAYGPVMIHRALQVAEMLARHDFHLTIVNMPWLNRVDLRWLRPLLSPYDQVYVLEDHASVGGLGDFLMRECATTQLLPRRQFRIFGADGGVTMLTGSELFRHHELDTEFLAAEILKTAGNLRLSYSALQAARDVRKTLELRERGESVRPMLEVDHELLKSL